MCRSIKPLFNFDPPATEEEIHAAALQFVRKLSGCIRPSKVNETAFNQAVDKTATVAKELVQSLVTNAEPRNRTIEARKAHERALKHFRTTTR